MTWFIPGNVPSSKNSKQWTGRFLVMSKTMKTYVKNTADFWALYAADFQRKTKDLPKPLRVEFQFVRDSRRKFDYINPAQTVQDLMTEHGWIVDDNCDEIVPVFLPYKYDPSSSGVFISVDTR
jgi:hypothetical protein